ncbi:MAG TPA: alpha/beta hydrolase [Bryobacteraceae bacterium]|nr:alpha/beta hydrolase [Bryobacteraceae bacterium]
MKTVWKSAEGEQAVRERYLAILKHWPVPNQQLGVPTREGETFVVVCGKEDGPPLVLLHGSMANSSMWMGDIAAWAPHFRIYAVDVIGDAGLSAPSRPPLETDAHALWLDDVFQALGLGRVSLAGVSLGGWLVLDYATRRPERVESVVAVCPAGVGRQKFSIVFKTVPLRLMGEWGTRKAAEIVLGKAPANPSPAVQYFAKFMAMIHEHFRARMVKFPLFSDQALHRLTMPVMAIVGGQDVLIDSAGTKRRLEKHAPGAAVRYLPEAGHFIRGQTGAILEFLQASVKSRVTSCS